MDDVNYLNCGTVRDRFRSYLNESKDHIEHARSAFRDVIRYVLNQFLMIKFQPKMFLHCFCSSYF